MRGLTFDTGALIALERRRQGMTAAFHAATVEGIRITVPAVVITEWWRGGLRERERLTILRAVIVEELHKSLAMVAGVALGLVRGSTPIDAIVMASAATRGDIVYTSDPDDLEALRRSVPLFANVPLVRV